MKNVFQLFRSDVLAQFASPDGLEAMPVWAERAAINLEFVTERVALDDEEEEVTPTDYLEANGVQVYHLVNLVMPELLQYSGKELSGGTFGDNFYWRTWQAMSVIDNDWFLRDKNGGVVYAEKKQPVANAGSPDYVGEVADNIVKLLPRRIMNDNSFVHWSFAVGKSGWELVDGLNHFYDLLRDAGVGVLANGAWQMSDPDAKSWHYPYMEHVDGVAIELTHAGNTPAASAGFYRGGNGKPFRLDDLSLSRVISDWREAGKDVLVIAKYNGGSTSFDEFAELWYDFSLRHWAWFSTGRDDDYNSATSKVWKWNIPW